MHTVCIIKYSRTLIRSDHFLSTGNQHLKEVAVRDCESHTVTLVRCQFHLKDILLGSILN